MKPSVGRVVHYVSYGTPGGEYDSECRAAIVTEVGGLIGTHATVEHSSDEAALGLCVLNPTGLFFNQGVIADQDAKRGGTWHWPERTEQPLTVNFSAPAPLGAEMAAAIRDIVAAELRGTSGHQPGARPPRY